LPPLFKTRGESSVAELLKSYTVGWADGLPAALAERKAIFDREGKR
jgi:hypothetical protein